MEPKEKGLLSGKMPKNNMYLVDRLMLVRMALVGITMMVVTLWIFKQYLGYDIDRARTMALTVLAVTQWLNAWNCRSETKSIFQMNPFSNMYLVGATAIIVGLQLLALYTPLMQKILHTVPLSLNEWVLAVLLAVPVILVEELRKFLHRLGHSNNQIKP
jgi:Ca2+-transporting ATPase